MKEDRVVKLPVFRTMFHPVARKPWTCCVCMMPVQVGKRYTHFVDRRAHEIIHYRFHDKCFMMTEAYCAERQRNSFTPRSVKSWYKNNHCKNCNDKCKLFCCDKIMEWAKERLKKL